MASLNIDPTAGINVQPKSGLDFALGVLPDSSSIKNPLNNPSGTTVNNSNTGGLSLQPQLGINPISPTSTDAITALKPGQYDNATSITKPTSVVSGSSATNQVNQAKNIVSTAGSSAQSLYNPVNGFVTPYGLSQGAKPIQAGDPAMPNNTSDNNQNTPTPEETIANSPDTGNQFYYDPQGNRVELPVGSTPPDGYTTNPPAVADTATTSTGASIKQMANGSYGLYGVDGKYIGPSNSDSFYAIKSGQQALKAFNDFLSSGGTTLNSAQQAQLSSVKDQYAALIQQQETTNANAAGGATIAQNLYGMGNTLTGHGIITNTINNGLAAIGTLTSKMNGDIANMTLGFDKDNLALVKAGFDSYQTNSANLQNSIDTFQATVNKQQAQLASNLSDVNNSFARKYPDTTTPILSTDTPDVLQAKLQTSPSYIQDQKTKSGVVDQNVLDGMLKIYNKTGTIPAGMGNASVELKKAFYAAIGGAPALADEATTNAAALNAAKKSLATQQTQYNATQTSIGAMKPALDLVLQDTNKLGKTGVPIANEYLQWLQGKIAGNSDITALNTAILTAANEYGKIVTGAAASIAGVTVSGANDVKNLLNSSMTTGQIESVIDTMKQDSNFRLNSYQSTLNQIKGDITELGNSSSSSSSSTGLAEVW